MNCRCVRRRGGGTRFSSRGIQLAVNWFKERGHQKVTVFVPSFRLEDNSCVEGKVCVAIYSFLRAIPPPRGGGRVEGIVPRPGHAEVVLYRVSGDGCEVTGLDSILVTLDIVLDTGSYVHPDNTEIFSLPQLCNPARRMRADVAVWVIFLLGKKLQYSRTVFVIINDLLCD